MLRVHRVKAEGPGLSSMSPDKRTNKRRKRLRKRRERERVNNKAAAKVVRLRWEYWVIFNSVFYVCLSECDGGRHRMRCVGCVITCDNYVQKTLCPLICYPGCSCPYSRPVWHRGQCVTRDLCKGSSIQLRFCV